MSVTVTESKLNPNYSIIKLERKFDTITAESVEEIFKQLYQQGRYDIILDFKESNYLSSMGLRVLFSASRFLNEKNKKLSLINIGPTVMKVIKIADCASLFTIKQDEEALFAKE